MPQIAQQDYIKLEIANISNLTEAEKEVIKKHIDNGTILDCLIPDARSNAVCRIVTYSVTQAGGWEIFFINGSGQIYNISDEINE